MIRFSTKQRKKEERMEKKKRERRRRKKKEEEKKEEKEQRKKEKEREKKEGRCEMAYSFVLRFSHKGVNSQFCGIIHMMSSQRFEDANGMKNLKGDD